MQRLKLLICGGALLTLLACNGGGGDDDDVTGGPSAGSEDSFTAAVRQLLATSPDDTEPVAVEGYTVVEVDDSEPSPL